MYSAAVQLETHHFQRRPDGVIRFIWFVAVFPRRLITTAISPVHPAALERKIHWEKTFNLICINSRLNLPSHVLLLTGFTTLVLMAECQGISVVTASGALIDDL